MGEDRTYSRTVATVALLAGVLLGVLGTNVFRAYYPNFPSSTAYIAPHPLNTAGDSLAVEAFVDSSGRVQDYRALSPTRNLSPEIKNTLIFTTFRPATFMGQPTNGTATLIFSDANGSVASSSQTQ
ncbi:MAG TPA: hypothetical protein VMG82_12700 [Candidatus Sulfotelmatobacter sp.]|nr:hypothetical protein [Candidatus Sulfotelmatobacter sp.]